MALTPQLIKSLMFEHFSTGRSQSVLEVANEVAKLAVSKNLAPLLPAPYPRNAYTHINTLGQTAGPLVADHVQQVMWQLLAQGVLVWGLGAVGNDNYPHYRLTEYGKQVVRAQPPQPYDPDGFITEFDRLVPDADPILKDYLVEAVRAFNANCFKSSAVMLGAASEQALLLLHVAFETAIIDPQKKSKFEKESEGITISRRYRALKDRLDLMAAAPKAQQRRD